MHDTVPRLEQHVIADDDVRHEERHETSRARQRQLRRDDRQRGRNEDAEEISLLLVTHGRSTSLSFDNI